MTARGDDTGIIDLRALLGEATAPERTTTVNPLTTVSNDVYLLLTMRDDAEGAPPPPAARDSLAAVTTRTSLSPAPKRHRIAVVISAALGATLVAGVAVWLLAPRAPITAAAAVRSTEPTAAVMPAATVNTSTPKAPTANRTPAAHRQLAAAHGGPKGHAAVATHTASGHAAPAQAESEPSPEVSEAPPSNAEAPEAVAEPATPAAEPPTTAAKTDEVVAPPTVVVEEPREAPAATSPRAPAVGPARPSFGAIAAAIRSALPAARTCLPPGVAARSGHIVFGSDGAVTSVQFPGTTSVDDCIRSALESAKVQPFREASFRTPFIVRR